MPEKQQYRTSDITRADHKKKNRFEQIWLYILVYRFSPISIITWLLPIFIDWLLRTNDPVIN